MANNHKEVVNRVNSEFPHLLKWNSHSSCAEFLQRVVNQPELKAESWGLLSKDPGENGFTWPNGQRTSHDAIALPNGERVDIIESAGAHPQSGGPAWGVIPEYDEDGNLQWRPNNVWVDISDWPQYISDAPTDATIVSNCIPAYGHFSFMTSLAEWPDEHNKNWDYIRQNYGPKVVRVMLCVEGSYHGSPDSWLYAGVNPNGPYSWEDRFKAMLDQLASWDMKAHCTVYGGRAYTETHSERQKFHDRIVAAAQGKWEAIRSFEMMNEYKVNRWTEEEVRSSGQDLASKLPGGFKLSLSSPDLAHSSSNPSNEQMEESFDVLYKDAPYANEITIHVARDHGKWGSPFSYNFLYPGVPKINNEPPGPGSSAGGMYWTGEDVKKDMQATYDAGWAMYVGHSEWCPWSGHIPQEYWNGWREIKEVWNVQNNPECFAAMKEVAGTSTTPKETYKLMSGESLKPDGQMVAAAKTFQAKYDKNDGNFVIYDANGHPIWASRTDGRIPAGSVQMNVDGNLVIYLEDGTPVWASDTPGHAGGMAQLQDDGYLVLYEDPNGPLAGTPYWRTDINSGTGGVLM